MRSGHRGAVAAGTSGAAIADQPAGPAGPAVTAGFAAR